MKEMETLLEKARVAISLYVKYAANMMLFHPDVISEETTPRLMELTFRQGIWIMDSSSAHLERLLSLQAEVGIVTLRQVESYELLHNTLHLLLLHWKYRGAPEYSNSQIYDLAADLHANAFIEKSDFGLSYMKESQTLLGEKSVLSMEYFPQFFGSSFKADVVAGTKGLQDIYNVLLQKEEGMRKKIGGQNQQGQQGQGQQNQQGQGQQNQQGQQQGQGQGLNESEKRLKELLDEASKNGRGRGHGKWSDLSNEQKATQERLVAEELERSLRSSETQSSMPAGLREQIQTWLESLTVDVDWKKHLMQALEKTLTTMRKQTIMRSSRRFPDGKGSVAKRVARVLVVVDTSGSMGEQDLNEAFNVLRIIQQRTKMKLYVTGCDAAVDEKSVHEYNGKKLPTNLVGGGGTDFEPALRFGIKHQFNAIVYLTDGYCTPPESQDAIKTIWVLTRSGVSKKEFKENGFKGIIAKIR